MTPVVVLSFTSTGKLIQGCNFSWFTWMSGSTWRTKLQFKSFLIMWCNAPDPSDSFSVPDHIPVLLLLQSSTLVSSKWRAGPNTSPAAECVYTVWAGEMEICHQIPGKDTFLQSDMSFPSGIDISFQLSPRYSWHVDEHYWSFPQSCAGVLISLILLAFIKTYYH